MRAIIALALVKYEYFFSSLAVTCVAQLGNSRPWIPAGGSHGLTDETKRP